MRWLTILFGLFALAYSHSLSDTTSTAQHFCNMSNLCKKNDKSVACLYTETTKSKCEGNILPFDTEAVINKHNEHRNAIATGEYEPQFKTAASMFELSYSDELALMASYNAKKCDFEHDACLSTNTYPRSGQNLAAANMTLGTFDVAQTDEYISEFIDDWFSEYTLSNMNEINSLPRDTGNTGHFLQVIQENCRYVGCALIFYVENGEDNLLFTCNYGHGNMQSAPVYSVGATGSKCSSKSKNYSGLCLP